MVELINGVFSVEVPNDSQEHWISEYEEIVCYKVGYGLETFMAHEFDESDNASQLEVIGLFHELTEDQARELAEAWERVWGKDKGKEVYSNYRRDKPGLVETALESLRSLLESKGLNPSTTNYLLIRKRA